jgi:hypothetical protein
METMMNDETQKVCAYLEAEMRRYWPDAETINARYDDENETWLIDVKLPSNLVEYVMEIGSDDSWFTFQTHPEGYEDRITIPYPEWLEG